jgi:hypothetical protein
MLRIALIIPGAARRHKRLTPFLPRLVTVLATVGGLIPLVIKGGPLWEPLCYVAQTQH